MSTDDVTTYTFPAFLAPALVNGDTSGLSDQDMVCLGAILAELDIAGYRVVDVARDENGEAKDPRFTWHFRLYGGDASGGNVVDFVAHKVRKGGQHVC